MSKKKPDSAIVNRRARHDYELKNFFKAGIVLNGAEVRSLRGGHGQLQGAFVNIKDGELWLFNLTINPISTNRSVLTDEIVGRKRKLLVKKRELQQLKTAKEQGMTIVPTKILTKGRFIKVELATARGLKKYDKRQKIKKRDTQRDIDRSLKPKPN